MENEEKPRHYHKNCLRTFTAERQRAEFAEARLQRLESSIRYLALQMDGINSTETYAFMHTDHRKTLGGAVRALIIND